MNVSPHALPHIYASAINLAVDLTFLAQFVLFGAFVTLLKPLLFDPLLRVFEEREKRTEGAKQEARDMDSQAGDLLVRFEAELAKVRREAGIERDRLRAEVARVESTIMEEARVESAAILQAGKAQNAVEVQRLRTDLAAKTPELATQIASRILDREVAR